MSEEAGLKNEIDTNKYKKHYYPAWHAQQELIIYNQFIFPPLIKPTNALDSQPVRRSPLGREIHFRLKHIEYYHEQRQRFCRLHS
jgi:hypothetical protein